MARQLRPALTVFLLLTLLTGVLYPLAVTGLAQALYPSQANGSLIRRGDQPVASSLIGQDFSAGEPATAARYFWARPSATAPVPYTAYNAETLTGSSGSNLGPANPALAANVQARIDALHAADLAAGYQRAPGQPIPVDLVTASGSGLDPHTSPAAARYQAGRVARARGLPEDRVMNAVLEHTHPRQLGVLGEPVINVVELNLALDNIQ
ncbi:MAG: potassium-transporting ATPase subunit KdpC [Phycisphaerales bacterium]